MDKALVEEVAEAMFLLDRATAGSHAEAEYIKWENFRLTDGGAFWIARAEAALYIALKAAAEIADAEMEAMTLAAKMAREASDDQQYYKANTAWWSAARIHSAIRALMKQEKTDG